MELMYALGNQKKRVTRFIIMGMKQNRQYLWGMPVLLRRVDVLLRFSEMND